MSMTKGITIKQEARILGIDDGPFEKSGGYALVVGTVFRGGSYPDAVLSTHVEVDGSDATQKLVEMIKNCRQRTQLHAVMIKGIALGGFNVVDIKALAEAIKIPVIVIIRDYPDFRRIEHALTHRVKNGKEKLALIKRIGKPVEINVHGKTLYMQYAGCSAERARALIQMSATHSYIPEPVRIAHMIAAGIVLGQSKGHA